VYIEHMPRLQVFLSHSICSSGARLGGTSAHREPPLTIPFVTTQEPSNRGSKWRNSNTNTCTNSTTCCNSNTNPNPQHTCPNHNTTNNCTNASTSNNSYTCYSCLFCHHNQYICRRGSLKVFIFHIF